MDIRLFEYFLAIAEEGNMTRAAELLHVTQPTLSKQLNKLEEILDVQLFERTTRKMVLTDAGLMFYDRAKDILELTEKAVTDLQQNKKEIHGTLKMSVAESDNFREIVKIFKTIHAQYPNIQFDIHSGDASVVTEQLDKRLIDFGLLVGTPNLEKYHALRLPFQDQWGVLLRKNDSLARLEAFTPEMLKKLPLIISKQALATNELSGWLGGAVSDLNVIASYNLINNAAIIAEEGLGYVLALDHLVNTSETSPLTFRPLEPDVKASLHLIWHKNQEPSSVAEVFLETVRDYLRE